MMGKHTNIEYIEYSKYKAVEEENSRLQKENEECLALLKYQHLRTREADKLWCKENNSPNMMPDLGRLIEWLMKERQSLKERLGKALEMLEDYGQHPDTGVMSDEVAKFLNETEDLK